MTNMVLMKALVSFMIVLGVCILQVQADVLSYDLVIERKLLNLDGFTRDGLTVNKGFIGPTIEATVGDNLLIKVTNHAIMQEVITLHWHGIAQKGTPWADGTAFVANCPITFGSSFVYNFTVDEPGTFWYHAHSGSLNAEGTTGMMVVYDLPSAASPSSLVQTTNQYGSFPYDEELRIILTDWYHPSAYTLNTMLEHNPFVWVGNGDSILINGKGESKHCSYNGTTTTLTATSSDGTTASTTTTCTGKREIFALEKDKTYLVRVLNAAYLAFFNLAIAGHYFTVLGVDGGSYTEPIDVNSLDLSSGQRVMALLRFNHSAVDASSAQDKTFLMQVQTDWRGPDTTHAGIAHAFVTYGNASQVRSTLISPLVPPNESRNWHAWYDLVHAPTTTTNTVTSDTCPTDAEVTKVFQIDAVQQFVDMRTGKGLTPARIVPGAANTKLAWTVYNDSRLMMPATPYLLSAYLNTLNNTMPDTTVPSRRLLSETQNRILNTDARGMSSLTASVEQSNKLHNDRKTHFYDQYEIVSAGDGPGKNIARPRIVSDHSASGARVQSTDTVESMLMAPALRPLRIELGDVVDIVVQAYASITGGCDLHPWHLHGHSFWQISRGAGLYGDSAQTTYVSEYPLRQDTISGYPTNHSETRSESGSKGKWRDPCGWFKIRFRADNPGMWLFHCHIGWHMEMGMAVVFDEASELVPPPPADYGMCGAAGDYQTFTSFASTTYITNTTTRIVMADAESQQHGVVMHILISFVVIFGVFLIVALLWVWLSRRKVNGMFVTLDTSTGAGELNANTMNPLSSLRESAGSEVDEESGVQLVSRHHKKNYRGHTSRKDGTNSSDYESCNNDKDDREESEEMVEVSFVRVARSAVQRHQSDKSGQKLNTKSSEEVSASDDEVSVGSISSGASHPVRKPLTWTSSQGLKK